MIELALVLALLLGGGSGGVLLGRRHGRRRYAEMLERTIALERALDPEGDGLIDNVTDPEKVPAPGTNVAHRGAGFVSAANATRALSRAMGATISDGLAQRLYPEPEREPPPEPFNPPVLDEAYFDAKEAIYARRYSPMQSASYMPVSRGGEPGYVMVPMGPLPSHYAGGTHHWAGPWA